MIRTLFRCFHWYPIVQSDQACTWAFPIWRSETCLTTLLVFIEIVTGWECFAQESSRDRAPGPARISGIIVTHDPEHGRNEVVKDGRRIRATGIPEILVWCATPREFGEFTPRHVLSRCGWDKDGDFSKVAYVQIGAKLMFFNDSKQTRLFDVHGFPEVRQIEPGKCIDLSVHDGGAVMDIAQRRYCQLFMMKTPWFAMTDGNGRFCISGLLRGTYKFRCRLTNSGITDEVSKQFLKEEVTNFTVDVAGDDEIRIDPIVVSRAYVPPSSTRHQ